MDNLISPNLPYALSWNHKEKSQYTKPRYISLKPLPYKPFNTNWNSPRNLDYPFSLPKVLIKKFCLLIVFNFRKSLDSDRYVSWDLEFYETLIFQHFVSLGYSMIQSTICNSTPISQFANIAIFSSLFCGGLSILVSILFWEIYVW